MRLLLLAASAAVLLSSCGGHEPRPIAPHAAVQVYLADDIWLSRKAAAEMGLEWSPGFRVSCWSEPGAIYLLGRTDPKGFDQQSALLSAFITGLDQLHLLDARAFHTPPKGATK